MDILIAAIVLLAPGGVATFFHTRLEKEIRGRHICMLSLLYTFLIVWILCFVKMARGWGDLSIIDSFTSVKNVVVYGGISLILAIVLPLTVVRLRLVERLTQIISRIQICAVTQQGHERVQFPCSEDEHWSKMLWRGMSLRKTVCIYLCALTVASVLLILVSAIPDGNLDENITISSQKLSKEGKYPELVPGSIYYRIDNWTEASLLNMIFTGDSDRPLEAAFAQKEYWGDEGDQSGVGRLAGAVSDIEGEKGEFELRSTYWLGVRVLLIPLLSLTDYYSLRPLLLFLNFTVLFGVAFLLGKRLRPSIGAVCFISFIMLNYFISALQWCNGLLCVWICAGVIALALRKRKKRMNYYLIFLVTGILTSFFDWFSVPLITFGIPTISILLYEAEKDPSHRFAYYFCTTFSCGVGWCLGYGGMLAGRVLLSTLVEGTGSWQNFVGRVVYNITSSGGTGGQAKGERITTILRAFQGVFPLSMTDNLKVVALVLGVCLVVVFLISLVCLKSKPYISVIGLISLAPFAWFILFNGYCRVHFWIAFRVFVITVFAWLAILVVAFCKKDGAYLAGCHKAV